MVNFIQTQKMRRMLKNLVEGLMSPLRPIPNRNTDGHSIPGWAGCLMFVSALSPLFWDLGSKIDKSGLYHPFLLRPDYQWPLKWILHLGAMHGELIVLTTVLLSLWKHLNYQARRLIVVYTGFYVFRFIEFWLWRYDFPIYTIILALLVLAHARD